MMTVVVPTIIAIVAALFAMMAIVQFMRESKLKDELPDNIVRFGHTRRHGHDSDRPAA